MKALFIALALFSGLGGVAAQERPPGFPSRPVRIVYGAPPGGQGDLVSRYLAERLSPRFGQPVLVDNRPGASGVVGLEYVMRQPPDGLTIAYGAAAWVVSNPALQPNLPFNILRDFRPVVRFGIPPQCLFVRDSLPARTAQEFIALARQQPGRLTYASFGIGSTSHLQMEMLKHITGTDMLHVPYRGSALAMQELATGRVDAFIIDFAPARPFMETGQARCLALTGTRRWPEFPDFQTFEEQGLPLNLIGWHALFVPAATPTPIVNYLAEEVMRISRSEEGQAALMRFGLFATADGPEETARIHREDLERWREAVRISGAKPE
jgi:tripartite-type tricarboxylate transporter receptor subunit TctC